MTPNKIVYAVNNACGVALMIGAFIALMKGDGADATLGYAMAASCFGFAQMFAPERRI